MLDKLTQKELKLIQMEAQEYSIEWLTEYSKEKNCLQIKDIWLIHQSKKQNPNLNSVPLLWLLDLGAKFDYNYLNILRTPNHITDDLVPSFLKVLKFLNDFHEESELT